MRHADYILLSQRDRAARVFKAWRAGRYRNMEVNIGRQWQWGFGATQSYDFLDLGCARVCWLP